MRSAKSPIAMSLFLSILTVFLQVSACVHARQQAPRSATHPCSPASTTPLSRRIFPKHGLDPITNLPKNAQRLPLPATGHGLVQATLSALSPSPTKHIPAQSSWLSHLTPGLQCSLFPQPWDSSCLLSCCFAARRGRRTITTAPNMSTKQREPYPGRRSAVCLWLASSTPSHSPGLDSRRCKHHILFSLHPLPPFLPENQS